MSAKSRTWIVLLTVFLDLLGFGIIIPVAPYMAREYGATDSEAAWLTGAFSVAQFLFVPFWGRLSDRIGRRPVMLASILGTAIAMTMFGAAPSLGWLFVARFAHGAMTANLAVAQAYMADTSEDADRTKAMGVLGAAFGMGFVFGPFLGGQLAEFGESHGMGFSAVGYGGAILSAINFVFAYFFLAEPERRRVGNPAGPAPLKEIFALPGLAPLLIATFFSIFAFANMTATYSLLTMDRLGWSREQGGPRLNGYVFGAIGIIGAIIQGGLIGRLVARFKEPRLIVVGLLLMACGMAGLGLMHSVPFLLGSSFFIAVGNSLSTPSLSSLVSVRSPPEIQGTVFGTTAAIGSSARVVGPLVAGLLYETVGSGAPYAVAAIFMVVTAATVGISEARRTMRARELHP